MYKNIKRIFLAFLRAIFYSFGAGASACLTICILLLLPLSLSGSLPLMELCHIIGLASLIVGASMSLLFSLHGLLLNDLDGTVAYMKDNVRYSHPIPFFFRTAPYLIFQTLHFIAWITEMGAEFGWHLISLKWLKAKPLR